MAASMMCGETQTLQILLNHYIDTLNLPVTQKIAKVTGLLLSSSLKDLKFLFARVVEDAFGFPNRPNWELITLNKMYYAHEFETLRAFFGPEGAVMQSAFKLLEDPSAKYEFPISSLPDVSAKYLREGTVPPLYVNLFPRSVHPGTTSLSLLLNAFEFYVFHFAYFITSPIVKNCNGTVNQAHTLYSYLLEDYLKYFVPTNGKVAPVPFSSPNQNVQTSPFSYPHQIRPKDSDIPTIWTTPTKSGFFSKISSFPSIFKESSGLSVSPPGNSRHGANVWHSETFLMILIEMYLNHGSVDQLDATVGLFKEKNVPNHCHVWMVRIIIKHLHEFCSEVLLPSPITRRSPLYADPLGELKSNVPPIILKHLQHFFTMTFNTWPSDVSFRVLLEAWLSYIQPWRYSKDKNGYISAAWQKFVTDNCYFYSKLFQHALHRFLRMDMSCQKNAYMLYRVTKVFAQDTLVTMIKEAERNHTETLSKSHSSNFSTLSCMSKLHTSYPSHGSFFRSHLTETKAPPMTSLFSAPVISQATRLLTEVVLIREKIKSQVKILNQTGSFFSNMFSSASADFDNDPGNDLDANKLDSHLKDAMNNLCKFFGISPPDVSIRHSQSEQFMGNMETMTPAQRMEFMNRQKKPEIKFHGNPDLQPVRTYESEILVKMFAEISNYLNDKYGDRFQQWYGMDSVMGRMCRQVLQEPTCYDLIRKTQDMESVTYEKKLLTPRICLRPFANKRLVFFMFMYFFVAYLFNWHPFSASVLMAVLYASFVFVKALFHYSEHRAS